MAIDLASDLTLLELANREDPKGGLADLVDVISKNSSIVKSATWIECNRGTYHEDTQIVFRPSGSLRGYDMGVTKEASGTQKVLEPTCMLDGLSEIDAAKLRHTPDQLAARLQEDNMFMAGMSEGVSELVIEGDRSDDPLSINGIINRSDYSALGEPNVYDNAGGDASATENKTFILIIQWGAKKVNMTYPRNDPNAPNENGIHTDDYGRYLTTDGASKKYPVWGTWFEAHFGLFISDPRAVKIIVNISTTNIDGIDDFSFNEDAVIDAVGDLRYSHERTFMYCCPTVSSQMRKRVKDKMNVNLNVYEPWGKPVLQWDDIPILSEEMIGTTYATWE